MDHFASCIVIIFLAGLAPFARLTRLRASSRARTMFRRVRGAACRLFVVTSSCSQTCTRRNSSSGFGSPVVVRIRLGSGCRVLAQVTVLVMSFMGRSLSAFAGLLPNWVSVVSQISRSSGSMDRVCSSGFGGIVAGWFT
ncbi:hypothetical protein OGATHE_002457 [Ogataea polymorpha]|uniref:Uncharacterized protein n=1 Tax=Ogataea polymorpha TaxID=460523 RepID=A0A9P8PDE3_9ASCO|nr:hypothetical protein OGATHE_002457 [Ogataea polymorpha]